MLREEKKEKWINVVHKPWYTRDIILRDEYTRLFTRNLT